MNNLHVVNSKSLRGNIVKSLYDIYDMPIPISKIGELLRYKNFYSKEDIKRATSYLAGKEKEFVTIEVNEKDYYASFIQLTPKGINLAEGDITDIGVLFNE